MRLFQKLKFILPVVFLLAAVSGGYAGWTRRDVKSLAWFRSIFFLDEKKGWIGGSGGALFSTVDGENWEEHRKFTNATIRDIYFSDEKNGWLLCERDVFNLGRESPSYLLQTTDGGANWKKFDFENDNRERVAKIFFTPEQIGFAVGESGAMFALQDSPLKWEKQPAQTRFLLTDGTFFQNSRGVIVGGGGTILFTEDSGLTWDKATVFTSGSIKFNSVFFWDQKNGWAVGADGKIFQTINGGKSWREENNRVAKDLNDVFFISNSEGFAAGQDGLILHTTTAGNVWTPIKTPVAHHLEKLWMFKDQGWAIGFGGTILHYHRASVEPEKQAAPQLLKRSR